VYRLPTGQLSTASNPLDVATGHGASAAGGRVALYAQWGLRVGVAANSSYLQSFGKTKAGAYPNSAGAPFPPSTSDAYGYTPGTTATLELAPRVMVTGLLGVSAVYDWQHLSADRFPGLVNIPDRASVVPVTTLDGVRVTPGSLQSAGFGITYSTVTEYERGQASLPIDLTFTHLEAIAGAARMPKIWRDQIQLRFYYRRGRR
jgi:hypothetical protein